MHNINKLRVYIKARANLKLISGILNTCGDFGDLKNQIQWAALSVVSNIAEGAGSGSDRQFARFLKIARGSNTELQAQIEVLADLELSVGNEEIAANIIHTGKMLSNLIKSLVPD